MNIEDRIYIDPSKDSNTKELINKLIRWKNRHAEFVGGLGVVFFCVYLIILMYIVMTMDFSNVQEMILNFPENLIRGK